MQLRDPPVTQVAEGSDELDRESEWIFKNHFCKHTVSRQEGYTREACKDWQHKAGSALEKIRNALDFIRQGNEPPFIAFYRKEYVQPELNINDLWRIFSADALWLVLLQLIASNLKTLSIHVLLRLRRRHSQLILTSD